MKLVRLRLSNFRSFGPGPTSIELDNMTFLLGPNGAGKTAVLQALARMFSLDPAQRRIRRSDFYIPSDEAQENAPDERELWIEAEFEFRELDQDDADEADLPAVPGNFAHMQLLAEDGPAQVRFRLKATIDQDDDIEDNFTYVISEDADGAPVEESRVSKQDRSAIQVHYLPARRDPADHISYSATALLGRALRSADWSAEREEIGTLTEQISDELTDNAAIIGIATALTAKWGCVHKGAYYANPSVSFSRNEIENLLRHLSVGFTPGHGESIVDFARLSDGQQSLLYVSLVLAMHDIGSKVLSGELAAAFDIDKLRPAVFTLIAIEEPENSLSPHYLGRIVRTLTAFAEGQDSQALVATHSPSLLRRVPPESVRYLRLSAERTTLVRSIELPEDESAQKFIREGVQAFPELYFSRLVVLGEGDSEQVVLPRLLEARCILADDASISVAPLGGRHVNHLWRLLNGLGIPHVTLLDLDVARHQGGWGRIRYAARQLLNYADIDGNDLTQEEIDGIPAWDSDNGVIVDDQGWIARLEELGVFFSAPLDLDFMMMTHYPEAYHVVDDELAAPDEGTVRAVLGKNHDVLGGQYTDEEQTYLDAYHRRFKLGSKPTWHIRAMAGMDDDGLVAAMPDVLNRMFDSIEAKLADLPE
ncbi:MAG: AAA family ATPase [Accumulibacter sp.]|jgi:putative ATP-dependent endonuclease of OLD family|uniref:ATP-dependent nuclease n=1 Tax=Accumulibacter sp. TaxID=2053492 RepID=UPI001AC4F8DF|nr:AAA family ATPase [Accumulibacter sp.]MBN8438006.1 AAA family ATPase [Accumulibacter sp.]